MTILRKYERHTFVEISGYLFGAALLLTPLVQLLPFMTKAHLVELLAIVVAVTLVLEADTRGGWAGAAACVVLREISSIAPRRYFSRRKRRSSVGRCARSRSRADLALATRL